MGEVKATLQTGKTVVQTTILTWDGEILAHTTHCVWGHSDLHRLVASQIGSQIWCHSDPESDPQSEVNLGFTLDRPPTLNLRSDFEVPPEILGRPK